MSSPVGVFAYTYFKLKEQQQQAEKQKPAPIETTVKETSISIPEESNDALPPKS